MEEVFELGPPLFRYSGIWNVNIVSDYLKLINNEDSLLPYHTYKLTTVLSVITGGRSEILHKIYVNGNQFRLIWEL